MVAQPSEPEERGRQLEEHIKSCSATLIKLCNELRAQLAQGGSTFGSSGKNTYMHDSPQYIYGHKYRHIHIHTLVARTTRNGAQWLCLAGSNNGLELEAVAGTEQDPEVGKRSRTCTPGATQCHRRHCCCSCLIWNKLLMACGRLKSRKAEREVLALY